MIKYQIFRDNQVKLKKIVRNLLLKPLELSFRLPY